MSQCIWKVVLYDKYYYVCKDPKTGQILSEYIVATHDEVAEVCDDYSYTGFYEMCRNHYLSLKLGAMFAKTYEEWQLFERELMEFLKKGFEFYPRKAKRART